MSALGLGSRAILGLLHMRLEQGAIGWIDRLAMAISSDQASETHKWLGMSPAMREHVGGRLVHGLREQGITITNSNFEATIAVMLDEIRRDKTGQVVQRINGLAARANSHGAGLLSTLILNGESTVCYDGQFFFDTDHSEGDSGTQDNDIQVDVSAQAVPTDEQGSTTAPSAKTMREAVLQGIQQILGFVDDQGEPINEGASEFMVMVPTPFWSSAVAAVVTPTLAGGETNVLAGLPGMSLSVVPNPRLTWTDTFAVFRADGSDGGAPFIKQEEVPLTTPYQAEGSPEEYHNGRHLYSVDWTGQVGYGFWQHACQVKLI